MSRRRAMLGVIMFVAPIFVVAAACSFPDVSFGPPSAEDHEPEAEAPEAAPPDVDEEPSPDGGEIPDVAVRDDATARVDASDCGVCDDCDNDGYWSLECDGGGDAAAGKKPGDCDDFDPLRVPGQTWVAEKPEGHNGDWNCDGKVEKHPPANLTCKAGLLTCSGGRGFLGNPPCGTEADTFICDWDNGKCVQVPDGKKVTVPCK